MNKAMDQILTSVDAHLPLSREGYETWLRTFPAHYEDPILGPCPGMRPSPIKNPLAEYVHYVLGTMTPVQTDGRHAWLLLQLTKYIHGEARFLRVVLPDWTVPLAMEYMAYPCGRHGEHPQLRPITRQEALEDLQRLVDGESAD